MLVITDDSFMHVAFRARFVFSDVGTTYMAHRATFSKCYLLFQASDKSFD